MGRRKYPELPKLPVRREKFALRYDFHGIGKRAAEEAGYSPKTAESQASRLLRDAKVQAYLAGLSKRRQIRYESKKERVRLEIAKLGFSNLLHVASWGPQGLQVLSSDAIDPDHAAALESVSEEERTFTDKQGNLTVVRRLRVKMHSKTKALDMLAREHGLLTDWKGRLDLGADGGKGKGTLNISLNLGTNQMEEK